MHRLKSNMDRFKGTKSHFKPSKILCLKSNMDRFKVAKITPSVPFFNSFKIQYG